MIRRGFTLLEAMVALVILGLVAVECLQVLRGTLRLSDDSARWTQAVSYAEDAMEAVELRELSPVTTRTSLPGGFARRTDSRRWNESATQVTVTISLPDGGEYRLDRLMARR